MRHYIVGEFHYAGASVVLRSPEHVPVPQADNYHEVVVAGGYNRTPGVTNASLSVARANFELLVQEVISNMSYSEVHRLQNSGSVR